MRELQEARSSAVDSINTSLLLARKQGRPRRHGPLEDTVGGAPPPRGRAGERKVSVGGAALAPRTALAGRATLRLLDTGHLVCPWLAA